MSLRAERSNLVLLPQLPGQALPGGTRDRPREIMRDMLVEHPRNLGAGLNGRNEGSLELLHTSPTLNLLFALKGFLTFLIIQVKRKSRPAGDRFAAVRSGSE